MVDAVTEERRVPQRGLIVGALVLLGLCVLGCAMVVVAGIPAFRGEIRDGVHDTFATEVAHQSTQGLVAGSQDGSYTLTATSLEARLRENLEEEDDDDALIVRITSTELEIGITSQGQDAIYTGTPDAESGAFILRDMSTANGLVGYLLSPETIANAIEDAINDHLIASNQRLTAVQLSEGVMTLVVN